MTTPGRALPVSGVGGWLSLLVLSLMVLGPLIGVGRTFGDFAQVEKGFPELVANAQWLNFKRISWFIIAASAAVSISAGYRLWKVHFPESVRFAIAALWISGPVAGAALLATAAFLFGAANVAEDLPEAFISLFGSAIVAGVWTAYLKRSARVRNTYRLAH